MPRTETMTETDALRTTSSERASWRRHWPAAVGISFAALITFDLTAGVEMSPVLAASAVVYLGAAALQRPLRPGLCSL
jgi:hypothetical protein